MPPARIPFPLTSPRLLLLNAQVRDAFDHLSSAALLHSPLVPLRSPDVISSQHLALLEMTLVICALVFCSLPHERGEDCMNRALSICSTWPPEHQDLCGPIHGHQPHADNDMNIKMTDIARCWPVSYRSHLGLRTRIVLTGQGRENMLRSLQEVLLGRTGLVDHDKSQKHTTG